MKDRIRKDEVHGKKISLKREAVTESIRRTPVAADVDVLVVGGGPAGVGAAVAAAREGAKTLLIERFGMLGGMWTAGLVNPLFDSPRKGWVVAEMIQRLEAAGAWMKWRYAATFDVEIMKRTLEEMMAEAGAEFWYYSLVADAIVEGHTVRGAIVESKAGREAVLAKVVVDASGDGDVAARAGAPYEMGRADDGAVQPVTLMFEVDGLGDYKGDTAPELYDTMVEVIAREGMDFKLPFERVNYAPWIILIPRGGAAAVQATHMYGANPLDPRDVTKAVVEGRRQAHAMTGIFRRIPGLENVRLTGTAPALGVRETRRVMGEYVLTLEDLIAGRRFDDAVTWAGFGVDIHDPAPGSGTKTAHGAKARPYEIPYRCLLPQEVDGILTAGRCISGTHEAHASYRVTGTCMGMGQAAGLAAAWAAQEGIHPRALDGGELRRRLAERGVGFLG
ncbi:MAG: FAD-dependent oxidoreductase [Planctomycetota bacterium]